MLDGVAYMTCDLGFIWNRLEVRTEELASEMFGDLGPAPVDGPKDICFFRMDSRT